MLKDLDETLKLLLSNNLKNDVIDQRGYKISFEPPSQEIENEGTIINLFLYDIRENVELRSSVR
ncbi:MAG: Pvc16 family protein, partial [Dolichospermum sp.]